MSDRFDVRVGDRVRYESAAGVIRGEVIDIRLARNAANRIIRWVHIEYFSRGTKSVAVLAETSLAMMKFTVIFRDRQEDVLWWKVQIVSAIVIFGSLFSIVMMMALILGAA